MGEFIKTVGRLRLSLSEISNIAIENVSYAYQLKMGHFIERALIMIMNRRTDNGG